MLRPAADFDPFQPAVGGGGALNAIRGPEPPQKGQQQQQQQQQPAADAAWPPPSPEQVAAIRAAAALALSHPGAAASLDVLSRLLGNLVASPHEARYRQVRLSNPRVRRAVADAPGGCELLEACGFVVHRGGASGAGDSGGEGGDEGFAAFLEDAALPLAKEGLAQLRELAATVDAAGGGGDDGSSGGGGGGKREHAAAAAAAATAAAVAANDKAADGGETEPAAPAAAAVERNLEVLLPVASQIDLDAAFFERTPAEVRAEYARLLKARRAGERLMTRAMREAEAAPAAAAAAAAKAPKTARVRVRFPEGAQLAATFGAAEPAAAIHAAVAAALRDPSVPFELVRPDRALLPRTGRVRDAGVAPAALLNIRAVGGGGGGGGAGGAASSALALSDEMLALAKVHQDGGV